MSHKIALTGIGVINGSFKGTNRFNLKLYDCTFDGLLSGGNNLDDLIMIMKNKSFRYRLLLKRP